MLEEKIAQMLLIGFKGTELKPDEPIVQAILARRIGGVILFGYNIQNPKQLTLLTQQLKDYAAQAGGNPLFISVDYEGGKVTRLKEIAGFPKVLSAAEIGDLTHEQARQHAEMMATALKEAGINMNFAPVVDVNVNSENPVIGKMGRSFSADPKKVTEYAEIFAKAYRHQGILCALKHFPGHGSSIGDTHNQVVDVTDTWKEYELEPYKNLLQYSDNCSMVMTSHVMHLGLDRDGYPASLSHAMTKKLLRDKLHFNGVVVTDDMQMGAITDNYGLADAIRLAINAGADILIFGNQLSPALQDPEQLIDIIYDDVMAGHIPENRIEESYQRIMKLKDALV